MIINIKNNGLVPFNHMITGSVKADLITVFPTVTLDVIINGRGGGDIIFAFGSGTNTVVYHSNDLLYVGGCGLDILTVLDSSKTVDLRGAVKHAGPIVTGFDVLDLTGGGTAGQNTLKIDGLGVDIFTGKINSISNTKDTMIVKLGQTDSVSLDLGWVVQPYTTISGDTYHNLSKSIVVCGRLEKMTLLLLDRAPIANADVNSITDSALPADLLGNVILGTGPGFAGKDTNVDNTSIKVNGVALILDTLTVSAFNHGGPAAAPGSTLLGDYGSLKLNADGSYVYKLNHAAAGHLAKDATVIDTFNYTLSDGHGATSSTTLKITVKGVNDAPVANADLLVATTDQNTGIANLAPALLANDTDVDDGHVLSVASVSGDAHISLLAGAVVFTPGTDFIHLAQGASAIVNFTYVTKDEFGALSTPVAASVTVTGLNDAPVAHTDPLVATTNQNTGIANLSTALLANDTDVDDGHVLSVYSVSGNAHISQDGLGHVIFTPGTDFVYLAQGEFEIVNFTYVAQDEFGAQSGSVAASIKVMGLNDAPVLDTGITDQTLNVGDPLGVMAAFHDPDTTDVLTYSLAPGAPAWLSINPLTGEITGTPGAGDVGVDIPVTVIATDPFSATEDDTFYITVKPVGYVNPLVTLPVSTFLDDTAPALDPTILNALLAGAAAMPLTDLPTTPWLLNYNLVLTSDTNVAVTDLVPLSSDSNLNQPTAGSAIPTDVVFAGEHYNLYSTLFDISGSADSIVVSGSSNNILLGGALHSFDDEFLYAVSSTGHNIIIGGENGSSSAYNLVGGQSGDILIGGDNTSTGTYVLDGGLGSDILVGGKATNAGITLDGGDGNDILYAGVNLGAGPYLLNGGLGMDALSFMNIPAGVAIDLGITGIAQDTANGGPSAGLITLGDTFEILQGTNFDDNLSFTLTQVSEAHISDETVLGEMGLDKIKLEATSTGISGGPIGNLATSGTVISSLTTIASNLLDTGEGAGGQTIEIVGTATGGSADASASGTFGNYALGGEAISAEVDINNNTLKAGSTSGLADHLTITAKTTGGNAGGATYTPPIVNTGANVADGASSRAISARSIVNFNELIGAVAGVVILLDVQAKGGNSDSGLYGNHAVNGGEARSADVEVGNNSMFGHGADGLVDTFDIKALAIGGNGIFTANIAGFDDGGPIYGGGLAIDSLVNVHDNVMTELGDADAKMTITATAQGGVGHFFASLAFAGDVISADIIVHNNYLTGGSGNDELTIHAVAIGSTENDTSGGNVAFTSGSTAIIAKFEITDNVLDGGDGNDTLSLLIDATYNTTSGGAGMAQDLDLTVTGNHLLGGAGDDVLIINNAALFDPASANILDGGMDFDSLVILQSATGSPAPVNLDLTTAAGTVVQNIERIDLLLDASATLTFDFTSVDALGAGDNSLYIRGGASDVVLASTGWGAAALVAGSGVDAGATFNHYTQTLGLNTVDLFIDLNIGTVVIS